MNTHEKLSKYIEQGDDVLLTHTEKPKHGGFTFHTLDSAAYAQWVAEIKIFSGRHLKTHPLYDDINRALVNSGGSVMCYYTIIGLLKAVVLDTDFFHHPSITPKKLTKSEESVVKEKINELIMRGERIKKEEYHVPERGLIIPDYIDGPQYDGWMNEIKIFASRNLRTHEFFDDMIKICNDHNRMYASACDKMLGYLKTLVADDDFWKTEKKPDELVSKDIFSRRFAVAVSFPGEHRKLVIDTVNCLASELGKRNIFYDDWYTAQLARINLDTKLQKIYHDQSDLIVVFICGKFQEKDWCGLEFRAIRDLIKQKKDEKIMLVRIDDGNVEGIFGIDGYIDAREKTPSELAKLILTRVDEVTAHET